MSALRTIIESLENGEFVSPHGRLVASLGDDDVASKAQNILEYYSRQAMKRRHEVIEKLKKLERNK